MKKYFIIFFIIFFCLFSLIGLGIKQRFYILETIIVGKIITLGPIIIYNHIDYSQIKAIYQAEDEKMLEEAQKTMDPEEFEKWKPWVTNTIRCSGSFCGSTSDGCYGFPFNYWECLALNNHLNLISLFFNLAIYFVLAFIFSGPIYLLTKKSVSLHKTGFN